MVSEEERSAIEGSLGLLSYAAGLAPDEAADVHGFVLAGEYGLALETLVAAVVEDGARKPAVFHVLTYFVAELLGLSVPPLAERLAARTGIAMPVTA